MCVKSPKVKQVAAPAPTPTPAEPPRVERKRRRRSIAAMAGDTMGDPAAMGQSGPSAVPTFGS